jgi:hypothetical protein
LSKKDEKETVSKLLDITYGVTQLSRIEKIKRSLKEFLKILGIFGGTFLVVLLIFFASISLIDIFPEYVTIQGANELLKILIQVDGLLMGFGGIIFAQIFSSLMDQQNIIYKRILDNPIDSSTVEEIFDAFERKKLRISIFTGFTFFFLLLSIFGSMANFARFSRLNLDDTYLTFSILFIPLFFLIVATVSLIYSLIGVSQKPPIKKSEN